MVPSFNRRMLHRCSLLVAKPDRGPVLAGSGPLTSASDTIAVRLGSASWASNRPGIDCLFQRPAWHAKAACGVVAPLVELARPVWGCPCKWSAWSTPSRRRSLGFSGYGPGRTPTGSG